MLFSLRHFSTKEIIVYLDDYKYSGDGYYDTMYLDFRTAEDHRRYVQVLGMKEPTRGSYLQIDNYLSPKRLMRGSYYALNMEMLKQLNPQPVEDSLLFAYCYNFNEYKGVNDDYFHLLQKHEPLNPKEITSLHHYMIVELEDVLGKDGLRFKVHNVSQANWNEVLDYEKVLYVYDMGAPIHSTINQVQGYIDDYSDSYSKYKPVLILSHWDMDHYHCLLQMSKDEIKSKYSKFICPDKKNTNTAQQLFDKMVHALGEKNIHCLPLPSRSVGSPYPYMHNIYRNGGMGLYIGENSRNSNYSGIILYVEGSTGNVVFSGDSLLVQANDALLKEAPDIVCKKNHHLIVPHHGGDFKGKKIYKTYNIPDNIKPIYAIISVDEANNTYGHPSIKMINYLSSVVNWHFLRTDKDDLSNPIELSRNLDKRYI